MAHWRPEPACAIAIAEPGPPLPNPCGELTAALFAYFDGSSGPRGASETTDVKHSTFECLPTPSPSGSDMLDDDDRQLALYCCYELSYRGFAGVSDELEWNPAVLALRAQLEAELTYAICADLKQRPPVPHEPREALQHLATTPLGPSLSRYLVGLGTIDQLAEFCIHRSAYQLKEADPHTWALPRLSGAAKAAMVEIQSDEYGGGSVESMHAQLFAQTLDALSLDSRYGVYLDRLPAPTLATVNLVTMFGLHRRWRGALVGHLALFEMSSVGSMQRYAETFDRFNLPVAGRRFFDVHVEVDPRHEDVALNDMVADLLATEPELADDVVFGAAALAAVEARFTQHLLDSWDAGRPSLR